jgi:2-amino-4-hydroxy-6-hydroxymethyldihydropteridine diphosphokinase
MGDRLSFLVQAVERLKQKVFNGHVKCSAVYETPPWGNLNQNAFFNMVVGGTSSLEPQTILEKALDVENELGRQRTEKWGPRTVDIDILLIDNQLINFINLQVPHPYLHQRMFVLQPLAELEPHLMHPVIGKTMLALCANCSEETFSLVLSGQQFEEKLLA